MAAPKIAPCLWFDKNAEEAMNFYVSVFSGSPHKSGNSRIISIARYEKGMDVPGMPEMEGKVINGMFELNGGSFMDDPPPGEQRKIRQVYRRHAGTIREAWDHTHGS